jgi:hypothetical protein
LETVVERDCRDVDGIKAATLMVIEEFIERWEVFTVLRPKWIRTPTTHCGEDSSVWYLQLVRDFLRRQAAAFCHRPAIWMDEEEQTRSELPTNGE